MSNSGQIYCFRANWEPSHPIHEHTIPDWLRVGTNWQGYTIWTVPWIADVARIVGALEIEDSPDGWKFYLESLGFESVTQVFGEDLFEETLYSI